MSYAVRSCRQRTLFHLVLLEAHSFVFGVENTHLDKVYIELEPESWHGHTSESLWATRLDDGLYKVENSPFFARGISYEDIVEVTQRDGVNIFVRTVFPSGGSTYRIILGKNTTKAQFEHFWGFLAAEGCTYEQGDFGYIMYSVDVPKEADIHQVFAFLNEGETQKVWDFEEGHCCHLTRSH